MQQNGCMGFSWFQRPPLFNPALHVFVNPNIPFKSLPIDYLAPKCPVDDGGGSRHFANIFKNIGNKYTFFKKASFPLKVCISLVSAQIAYIYVIIGAAMELDVMYV